MKAVQITGSKEAHKIQLIDSLPKPVPKGNQVLVKVVAAGITADEVGWPELYHTTNQIPGHDISGIVAELGPEYRGSLSVGDSVFAMLAAGAGEGGQAEYTIAAPDELALKPASISHGEAAALPIPVLTAWEAIFTHAPLHKGTKILVTGASGAVGIMLVQIASRLMAAEVIALASPQNHARLKELGASQCIDYNTAGWEKSIHGVDAVFDTVGGATLDKAWNTLKSNGSIVTVADPAPSWAFGRGKPEQLQEHPDVKSVYFIVTATGDNLGVAGVLMREKVFCPLPVSIFPVERAVEAWEHARQRGRAGKVVIQFAPEK